ncbi:hypothetical protein [Nocardioides sp. CER19]|uniref:hypothetical protein n=1 Tax=Nocardioides sp. CER19 TaxID=3038538 RepID=UPI00244A7ABA|nr:hypothetical protein [Nocardioides sp. CER19]MDH2416195.1 hypothetical protein [Nocardioides sp. CER19]
MLHQLRRRALVGTGAIALGLTTCFTAAAGPASATGDDGVRTSGACIHGGHLKLKAKHDDGRIEVEFEVDSNRAGQNWTVRIRDDGALVVARHARTAGRSGSFSVEKKIANRPGPDKIRARATFKNRTCTGTVVV